MLPDEPTTEVAQLKLPPDLLAAVARPDNHQGAKDFSVDGWSPTMLERLARMLGLG